MSALNAWLLLLPRWGGLRTLLPYNSSICEVGEYIGSLRPSNYSSVWKSLKKNIPHLVYDTSFVSGDDGLSCSVHWEDEHISIHLLTVNLETHWGSILFFPTLKSQSIFVVIRFVKKEFFFFNLILAMIHLIKKNCHATNKSDLNLFIKLCIWFGNREGGV